MNTTYEIEGAGGAWPPAGLTPQQEVADAVREVAPWNLFPLLPPFEQGVVVAVLAAIVVFAGLAVFKVMTGKGSLFPRTSRWVGLAGLAVSGLCIVFIGGGTALGLFLSRFSFFAAACVTIICLYALAAGVGLWALTRFVSKE